MARKTKKKQSINSIEYTLITVTGTSMTTKCKQTFHIEIENLALP